MGWGFCRYTSLGWPPQSNPIPSMERRKGTQSGEAVDPLVPTDTQGQFRRKLRCGKAGAHHARPRTGAGCLGAVSSLRTPNHRGGWQRAERARGHWP